MADVNLLIQDGLDYIEIVVSPQAYPVNYDGEYHYRSGSTKQLLRGNALTGFLMTKTGIKWESAPVSNISIDDLDKESFDIFKREALRSAIIEDSKEPKHQNEALDEALEDALEIKVLKLIRSNPQIKQAELVTALEVSRATIQRLIKSLSEKNVLERKGGKRYGYWEVHE